MKKHIKFIFMGMSTQLVYQRVTQPLPQRHSTTAVMGMAEFS